MMLCALSCSDVGSDVDNDVESPETETDADVSPDSPLKINSSTEEIITKGELVYEADDMGSIGLYCAMTGYEKWSEETVFSKLENRRFFIATNETTNNETTTNDETITNDDWQIDGDPELWGFTFLTDMYTFFAYSPFSGDTQGVTPRIEAGELIIDYVAPTNSEDQPDLMYATPRKDIYAEVDDGVSLKFHHTLSCVSFGIISVTGEKITNIEISGVVSEGSLSWDYEHNEPTWSLGESKTTSFSVDVDKDYTPNSETSTQINTEQGYLMMIPQEIPNGAKVTLTIDGSKLVTLMIPSGSEWEAGFKYNYIIRLHEGSGDFIFDSEQISNCYIINPTPNEVTVVQIPIEDRINDFWKNYSGKDVKKIKNASTTDDFSVSMVWEDFEGNLTFDYLLFDDADDKMAVLLVIPADFQEGNFVFAVKDFEDDGSQNTLWSWHLWFTDYNPDAIAAANIGNIELGVDRKYELDGYEGAVHRYKDVDNTVTVWGGIYDDKFIMDRNIGERNSYTSDYGAGAVYYQFGRKDPFPGNGAWYSDIKSTPSVRSLSACDFYEGVEYSSDLIFSSTSSSNNWSGETAARNSLYIWFDKNLPISTYDTGKSIFDPSPLGWRVPVSDTWSSFDDTGSTQSGYSNASSVGVYNLYGCRIAESKGTLSYGGEVGYVWSANPDDAHTALSLYYSKTLVFSPYDVAMSYALPVRAIQE